MILAPLPLGSLIGVVAPAGPVARTRLARVAALYEAAGYRARLYPGCRERSGYLAGNDDTRLADLHQVLRDDDVQAIHCLRGGYGCMRILDRIDAALVRRARKLLIGFSDITALQALWSREGLASLHAPMPASHLIHAGNEADRDALFALLQRGLREGDVLAPELDPAPRAAGLHAGGHCEGRLIGGNLSLVAALLGTPWAWDAKGAILFLEDINEQPYRVDRLLTQLRLAGVLDAAAGFLIGNFSDAASPLPLLQQMLLPLGKPLLAGWPAGHQTPNRPLPLGARARLDADTAQLTLLSGPGG
ncbi:MAG: LD-carboxypeptidase [Rubrivivax sp.]